LNSASISDDRNVTPNRNFFWESPISQKCFGKKISWNIFLNKKKPQIPEPELPQYIAQICEIYRTFPAFKSLPISEL
jgi:hypothetical protein